MLEISRGRFGRAGEHGEIRFAQQAERKEQQGAERAIERAVDVEGEPAAQPPGKRGERSSGEQRRENAAGQRVERQPGAQHPGVAPEHDRETDDHGATGADYAVERDKSEISDDISDDAGGGDPHDAALLIEDVEDVAAERIEEIKTEAPKKNLERDETGGEFFAEDSGHDATAVNGHVEDDGEGEGREPAYAEADFGPEGIVAAFVTGRQDGIHGLDEGVGENDGDEDEHGGGVVVGDGAHGAEAGNEEVSEIEMERGEDVDGEKEAGVAEESEHALETDGKAQAGMAAQKDNGGDGALEGHAGRENGGDPADVMREAEDEEAGGGIEEFAGERERAVPMMFLEGAEQCGDREVPGVKENPSRGEIDGRMEGRFVDKYEREPAESGGDEREDKFEDDGIPEQFRSGGWIAGDVADEEGPEAEFAENVENDDIAEGEGEAAVLFIADDFDEGSDEDKGDDLRAGLAGEQSEGIAEDAVGVHSGD